MVQSCTQPCELEIRCSCLLITTPEFAAMLSSIYLYVTDCDTVYQRALSCGGISVFPMMTLPSGQRYGGVKAHAATAGGLPPRWRMFHMREQERRWKEFKMP